MMKAPIYHTPPLELRLYERNFDVSWFLTVFLVFIVGFLYAIWPPLGIGLGGLILSLTAWAYGDHLLSQHRFGNTVLRLCTLPDHRWELTLLSEGQADHLVDTVVALRVRRRYTKIVDGDPMTRHEELLELRHLLLDLLQPTTQEDRFVAHLPTPATKYPSSGTPYKDGHIVWDLVLSHRVRGWSNLRVEIPLEVVHRTKLKFAPPSEKKSGQWWRGLL